MKMKKLLALLTVLALLLCSGAFAEEDLPALKTGVYTVINKTGETVTEVKITDNVTGESNVFPINEEEGLNDPLTNDSIVVMYFDIPGAEDGEHRLTLSYKTESGREESFGTLSIEEVTIELLAADAMTGATPIAFSMPKTEKIGKYTFYNGTGEKVLFLNLIDNEDGAKIRNAFQDGLAPDETYTLSYVVPEGREDTMLTLQFVTESGDIGIFSTLKIEEVPITLLDVDSVSGATPIAFSAPN